MVSGTAPPTSRSGVPPLQPQSAECESYIDRRLRQTRQQVKRVDLWAGLIALAAAALAYLLLAAVADHWLLRGGLSFWGRLVLFAGLLVGGTLILVLRIAPPLIHRVNPIFAAHSIEQSRPSLKNSLVNLLYLRRERNEAEQDALGRGVYRALERKAATDLTEIPGDIAVDRSHLVRLGSVLAAVLAVSCLYLALSPKSTMASLHRVVWPWADIKAPTRVTIEGVAPGDGVAYQGDLVGVSAEVDGLADGEEVLLYYTTADGQSVDQAIPMTRPEGRSRYGCDLPPGRFGLQQDVEYYLAAGDCRTPRFKLEVETAPSIVVDRVEYDYPEYTGISDRIDRRLADLKAIEGTRVTLHATANQQINRAAVEFDGDPRHALRMTVEESRKATARFTLAMDPDNPGRPQRESYQLRFTDTSGRASRRPIRHRIEVIADLAPEVSFVDPPPEEIELAEDGALEFRIRAEDPDFALRRVALCAERDDERLPIPPLCGKPRPDPPHAGPFQKTYRFEPARLGLKAGDRVIYWAEAEDNMFWEESAGAAQTARVSDAVRPPNRSETARRWITITRPEGRRLPAELPKEPETSPAQAPEQESDEPKPAEQDQQKEPRQDQPQNAPHDQPSGEAQEPQQGEPEQQQTGEQNADRPSDAGEAGSESQQPGENSGQEGTEQQGPGQQMSGQQEDGQEGKGSPSASAGEGSQSGKTSQSADPQTGSQTGGQPSPRREPIDGETNAGDAFEEILKRRAEQQRNQDASGEAGESGEEPGQGAGEQAEEQKIPGNRPANGQNAGPNQQQSEDGEGDQAKGLGEPDREESSTPGQENPEAQGGDPNGSKGQAGEGKPSSESTGSPSPQGANQPRQKQSSEGDQGEPSAGESAQSPSTSPKDSNSQGETSGDRSGGGEEGGGQRSKQTGTGAAGTHSAAEQGGSPSDQQGEGEAGTKAGDQMQADRPTGQAAKQGEGPGSSGQKQPGGERPAEKPRGQQDGPPSGKPSSSGQPGDSQTEGSQIGGQRSPASGVPGAGGEPNQQQGEASPAEPGTDRPEDANLEFARKATNLALEYLEDELAKDQPDQELLDRLGWSKDDLKRFYQQWDRMRREADGPDVQSGSAREEMDKALDSLGLRPSGTELEGGRTKPDRSGNLKEGLRLDPPPEWAEAFRAYTTGVAGGGEDSDSK